MLEAAIAVSQTRRKADLDDLIEELRIPSISALAERRADCVRNAHWLGDRFESMGMKSQIVDVDGGNPIEIADWIEHTGKSHLTFFGYYAYLPIVQLLDWHT